MKLAILIVLYNTTLHENNIIKSLFKADFSCLESIELHIWDNGPNTLSETDINGLTSVLQKKELPATLYSTEENISLAYIYNYFIEIPDVTHYLIFDGDTTIQNNFFTNLQAASDNDLILPLVFETHIKKNIYPTVKPAKGEPPLKITKTGKLTIQGEISTVMSGICLSKKFITSFSHLHFPIFENRFGIYGVDTYFLYLLNQRIKNVPATYAIYITNTIQHELAEFIYKDTPIPPHRNLELTYAGCLHRIFTKNSRRAALSFLLRKRLHTIRTWSNFYKLIQSIIHKEHSRNTQDRQRSFVQAIINKKRLV